MWCFYDSLWGCFVEIIEIETYMLKYTVNCFDSDFIYAEKHVLTVHAD